MPFVNKDDFTVTRIDPIRWMVENPLVWRGHQKDTVVVPAGHVTDFATVPWFAQWLIPRTGTWTLPAVGHDRLCDLLNERYKRVVKMAEEIDRPHSMCGKRPCRVAMKQAQAAVPPARFGPVDTDGAMRAMMEDEDVDPIRRWLIWTGVRWGATSRARRVGWWRTAHLVLPISVAVLAAAAGLAYGFVWLGALALGWI